MTRPRRACPADPRLFFGASGSHSESRSACVAGRSLFRAVRYVFAQRSSSARDLGRIFSDHPALAHPVPDAIETVDWNTIFHGAAVPLTHHAGRPRLAG